MFNEHTIDTTPYQELKAIAAESRKITLQLYDTTLIGDCIIYEGHYWKVTGRLHHAYEPYERCQKKVSELELEYIGKVSEENEPHCI